MDRLIFRYRISTLVMMCAGFPVLGGLGVLLLFPLFYPISRNHLSVGMRVDAIFCGGLGVFFLWIWVTIARSWRSYFSIYTVDRSGIKARFFSTEAILSWKQLKEARYRKSMGQIDLRFDGYPYLIVLNNSDMNRQRRTVRAALSLIENIQPGKLKQTLI